MVPGHLLGLYTRDEITLDLKWICERAGGEFIAAKAVRVDASSRKVSLADGRDIPFDIASFNLGGKTEDSVNNSKVVHLKPLTLLLDEWQRILEHLKTWQGPSAPKVAVIGGGPSGIELTFALASLTSRFQPRPLLSVWQRLDPMNSHGPLVKRLVVKELKRFGVRLRTGIDILSWENGALEFKSVSRDRDLSGSRGSNSFGREDVDFVLLATPVKPEPIFRDSGLPTDDLGFLKVNECLQVPGYDFLFGAGDCVEFPKAIPRSGVFAVKQGRHLVGNLLAAATGQTSLKKYHPQPRSLALITLGGPRALASYGQWGLTGKWLWRLKDRIDRGFMNQYQK